MKYKRPEEKPEIPTASMADIAFLLIVFFMLTTVFSANRGIEHILPAKDEVDNPEDEEAIYIQIFPGHNFEIDGKSHSIEDADEAYDYVMMKVQQNAKKPIILHTNREATYGDMVAVLNEIEKVGRELKLDLALTIPSKDEAARYERYGVSL